MPRLSRAQELTRQQIIQLALSGLSPNQLGERLLAAIELAVAFDGAQLYAVDPTTLLFNRLLGVSAGMQPHIHWYIRNLYLNEPFADLTHPNLMRAGLTAVVLHDRPETSWGLPGHLANQFSAPEYYRAYHTFTGADGGVLRAFFQADGLWIAALDLARFDAHRPFRPADVAFLRLIAPTIGRLIRAVLDRDDALSNATTVTMDACGVLILAPNGSLRSCTPAAENWIKLLQDAGESQVDHLPSVIWSAIAGLRAGEPLSGQARVRASTRSGQVRIEALPLGDDGSVAVVLAPYVQPLPPAIPSSWDLTRQEQQVVGAVVRGLSNRQIAKSLVVTEDTIESHLRHIYAKLNVHSRSQLIVQYFARVYNPDLVR